MAITNEKKTVKVTKAMRFAELLTYAEVQANPEMVAFIQHEIELLAKKNSADKKPTKVQEANEALMVEILDGMEDNRAYTVTEVIKEVLDGADYTNQKISALMRKLVDAGKVVRTEEKRKAFYTKA